MRLLTTLSTRAGSVEAIRDNFRELKAQNAASLAATRAAFEEFLGRVDPKELEERFDRAAKRGVFGAQNKAKYWDLYAEMFAGLAQRPADGFPHVFTETFAKAYEAKLRALVPPRRTSFGADRARGDRSGQSSRRRTVGACLHTRSGRVRLLVVEDDDIVADAITRGLAAANYSVHRVASAEAAQAALADEEFALAVIDVGLPGADGLTLVRRLRSAGKTLPTLILTARCTLTDKVKALDLGADDFLSKPFEAAELAARCRALDAPRAAARSNGIIKLNRMSVDLAGQAAAHRRRRGRTDGARMAGARMSGAAHRADRLQGTPAAGRGQSGSGHHAERSGSPHLEAARQARRRRRDPQPARLGLSARRSKIRVSSSISRQLIFWLAVPLMLLALCGALVHYFNSVAPGVISSDRRLKDSRQRADGACASSRMAG